jgi:hypothetical protein
MTAWIDADETGDGPVPERPDENRPLHLALATIGVVSFGALLMLP